MDLQADDAILKRNRMDIRNALKKKIIVIQKERLVQKMLTESKADRILLTGFCFDGKMKSYLRELPFQEARAIFMLRARMLPTKDNFRGRWGYECSFCSSPETDMHLFSCAGYSDLLEGVEFDIFFKLQCSTEELSANAKKLLKVIERLEVVNKCDAKSNSGV